MSCSRMVTLEQDEAGALACLVALELLDPREQAILGAPRINSTDLAETRGQLAGTFRPSRDKANSHAMRFHYRRRLARFEARLIGMPHT